MIEDISTGSQLSTSNLLTTTSQSGLAVTITDVPLFQRRKISFTVRFDNQIDANVDQFATISRSFDFLDGHTQLLVDSYP